MKSRDNTAELPLDRATHFLPEATVQLTENMLTQSRRTSGREHAIRGAGTGHPPQTGRATQENFFQMSLVRSTSVWYDLGRSARPVAGLWGHV